MHHMPHHGPAAAAGDESRRPWNVLVLLGLAQFMVVLDITVVNVALPSIGRGLGFTESALQWVVTAYLLFTGGLLLLGGRLADLLGRRAVFLTGLVIFTGASLASGLAGSPEWLIVSRAAQGLGAALLTPSALSILTTTYGDGQRTTALAAWGAIASGGAAAGMLFGGMLTSWLSWEWVFLINVPIGIVLAFGTLHLVEPTVRETLVRRELDLPGAALVMTGLIVLVYALQGTSDHGWGSARTLLLLAAAAATLVVFASYERRASHPLIPPGTWRSRPLRAGAAVMLGVTGLLVGAIFLSSLYLQEVLDTSAVETGLAFLPIALSIGAAAHATPHVLSHLGTRGVVLAGLALITASAAVLAAGPDDASYAPDLLPGFVLLGLGVGLILPAANIAGMSDVGHDDAGLASGVMSTAHELGAALGVAVLAAIAAGAGTGGLVAGFEDAFLAVAAMAVALAAFALAAMPAVRPAPGAAVALH